MAAIKKLPDTTAKKSIQFIVDAQLPKKLSDFLIKKGFESLHTLDLPDRNATSDKFLKELAYKENKILITKDDDFLQSYIIEKKPSKLILIKTGNISNKQLIALFENKLSLISSLITNNPMIEITNEEIIVHK